jgi:hypothetical protein
VNPEYAAWIAANVDKPYGTCREATHAMVVFFPELRRARGFYDCWVWGERTHWWCVASDGSIVDPTAAQFPSRGLAPYREITDESEIPTGACLNCGGFVFGGQTFCSDACGDETDRYMQRAVGAW